MDTQAQSGSDDRDVERPLERLDRNWSELLQELRVVQTGIAALGLAVVGVVVMIFDTVLGPTVGVVAGVLGFVLFAGLWAGLPWSIRRSRRSG